MSRYGSARVVDGALEITMRAPSSSPTSSPTPRTIPDATGFASPEPRDAPTCDTCPHWRRHQIARPSGFFGTCRATPPYMGAPQTTTAGYACNIHPEWRRAWKARP